MYRLMILFCLLVSTFGFGTTIKHSTQTPQYFLVLSDIHFDPFTSCTQRPCALIQQLRKHAPNEWLPLFKSYEKNPSRFTQDTNGLWLEKNLDLASKIAKQSHAQFVLVLGDFLGHDFFDQYQQYTGDTSRAGYQAFLHKVFVYLTLRLQASFPGINIVALPGNNDAYQGDYVTVPNGTFFREVGELWSGMILDADQASIKKQFDYAGFYALNFPKADNAKLIMLNTTVFSYKARGKKTGEVANRELAWLHEQLQQAKKNNQRVVIAMHIPEAIDAYVTLRTKVFRLLTLWKPDYIKRFQAELQLFAPNIAGVFAGHLHTAYSHVSSFDQGKQEIPLVGAPAISPIFGIHTGFQLFSYTPAPLQITGFVTTGIK